jgi:hypothetical protein
MTTPPAPSSSFRTSSTHSPKLAATRTTPTYRCRGTSTSTSTTYTQSRLRVSARPFRLLLRSNLSICPAPRSCRHVDGESSLPERAPHTSAMRATSHSLLRTALAATRGRGLTRRKPRLGLARLHRCWSCSCSWSILREWVLCPRMVRCWSSRWSNTLLSQEWIHCPRIVTKLLIISLKAVANECTSQEECQHRPQHERHEIASDSAS